MDNQGITIKAIELFNKDAKQYTVCDMHDNAAKMQSLIAELQIQDHITRSTNNH